MEEPHTEDLASHGDPESCAGPRKGAGEALTWARGGRVLSRENRCDQGADAVVLCGRPYGTVRQGEHGPDPARSKTPGMRGTSMRENREIPCLPRGVSPVGRGGKVGDRKPPMHEQGKSDRPILCAGQRRAPGG